MRTELIYAAEAAPLVPSLPYFWDLQVKKINQNKLCLQMNHRPVLTIKGVKKWTVMLHHCKAENVVVSAEFPYLQSWEFIGTITNQSTHLHSGRWCNVKSMQAGKENLQGLSELKKSFF